MSRYNCTDYIIGAAAVDNSGDVCRLSELSSRTGLTVEAYYVLDGFFGPLYYQMADLTGYVSQPYGGSTTLRAVVRITDRFGGVKIFNQECEGWPRSMSCYLLLSVIAGESAAECEIDFQQVEEVELREGVGSSYYENWRVKNRCSCTIVELDNPPFNP